MNALERAMVGEVLLLAVMGPFGIVRLWRRHRIGCLRLFGATAGWVAIGWTMFTVGIVLPDILFEMFMVGVFMYGAMVCSLRSRGSDKAGVAAVMLLAFLYTASAFFKLYALRTSSEQRALDLVVVAVGYVGFLLACWPAIKAKP